MLLKYYSFSSIKLRNAFPLKCKQVDWNVFIFYDNFLTTKREKNLNNVSLDDDKLHEILQKLKTLFLRKTCVLNSKYITVYYTKKNSL